MSSVTAVIYNAAGSPPMDGDIAGICRACGETGTGLPFGAWVKETFTNHDILVPGTIVCHACLFCFTDSNAPLTERTGKDKPQRMRNYSHFVVDGAWYPLSKGDKRKMRELLFAHPAVAVIADSGQKHIIFRARPSVWQFEETPIYPQPAALLALLNLAEPLYFGGFTKDEIATGRYIHKRIATFGIEAWHALEAQLRPHRATVLLDLALFLLQKEETTLDA